ncbi:MAG: peptide chain release factor N(5)-glutamine methyltransferase, partial [Oxalobacteraceae bacterium]
MSPLRIEAGCEIASLQRNPALGALETRMLLMHALGLTRVQLITQSERRLSAEEAQRYSALLQR